MADLIRAYDWGETPLGPIEFWSGELNATVNLALASPTPAGVCWGAELIWIYNDAFRQLILGERHPQALGKPVSEVWRETWRVLGPQFAAALDHGETTYKEASLIPVRRDGILVDRYWNYTFVPLFEEGSIAGVFTTCVDVTDAVQASRERVEIGDQLEQVLAATTDGIASMDRSWRITYLNGRAREIVGAMGDPLGRNLWEVFPDAVFEGSPYLEHYHRAMDDGIASEFEAFYPEPLNAWLKLVAQPSKDGIVVFFRDVTEGKKAEAALLQSEKLAAVGRLASTVAHEINNPLESVTNLIYLARTSGELSDENLEYLETAERELRRISIITNQTLSFHKQLTALTPVFCHELIEGGLSIFQGRLVNSKVVVEKRKRAIQRVLCYDGEVRQVINNLIGNALDAMQSRGGRLLIRSREGTRWGTGESGLVLTFADTGEGMSATILSKIFDPFFSTKGIGGTGLGLWVCQEIVQRHRGLLRVRSKEGGGTVFTLFLPFEAVTRLD